MTLSLLIFSPPLIFLKYEERSKKFSIEELQKPLSKALTVCETLDCRYLFVSSLILNDLSLIGLCTNHSRTRIF